MLKLLVGLLTPKRISGLLLLKQRLRHFGLDPATLPEAFLTDVVAHCEQMAGAFGQMSGRTVIEEFGKSIEGNAVRISEIMAPDDPLSFAPVRRTHPPGLTDPLLELMEKHQIKLP